MQMINRRRQSRAPVQHLPWGAGRLLHPRNQILRLMSGNVLLDAVCEMQLPMNEGVAANGGGRLGQLWRWLDRQVSKLHSVLVAALGDFSSPNELEFVQ
jgi:hypothetical protein